MPNGSLSIVGASSPQAGLTSLVDQVSLNALQNANLVGGDVIMTTALGAALQREHTVTGIAADLTIAKDYETYLANADAINSIIEVNPNSSFAAG